MPSLHPLQSIQSNSTNRKTTTMKSTSALKVPQPAPPPAPPRAAPEHLPAQSQTPSKPASHDSARALNNQAVRGRDQSAPESPEAPQRHLLHRLPRASTLPLPPVSHPPAPTTPSLRASESPPA